MIIVSYDIANDKLRTKFAKFLSKYGCRLQYSVFKIQNSERLLDIVSHEIEDKFSKDFTEEDSVYVFQMSSSCKMQKYGYAKNEDCGIIVL